MKLSFVFLLAIVLAFESAAQKNEGLDITSFPRQEVKLNPGKSKLIASFSFSGLEVYDRRNDTSFLGFYKIAQFDKSKEGILKTEQPTFKSIQSFLEPQMNFDQQSQAKLILIVRKLWLSKEIENDEIKDYNPKMQKALLPGVIACIEFYAKQNDDYIPLYRFDSAILHYNKKLEHIDEDLIKTVLKESILAISKTNYQQKIHNGKKYTWLEVDSFSRQFGNLKTLRASTFKKGVYKSYNEFINDQPSIKNFEIKKSELSQVLIVKDEMGVEYPIRKIWGFSDGEQVYIKSIDAFFPLEKFNNNFYAWAAKSMSLVTKISIGDIFVAGLMNVASNSQMGANNLRGKKKAKLLLKLYQLDPETGILY